MSTTTPSLKKRLVAELLGTFTLVFLGTFAVTTGQEVLIIGLSFGIAAVAAIYAFGHVSGAHLNPAVTISLAVKGKFPWKEAAPYAIAQVIGSLIAALLNASIIGEARATSTLLGATIPVSFFYSGTNPVFSSLILEITTTFILVLTILYATEKEAPSGLAGLAIGLVLGINVMLSADISGGSMNPARSFGPVLALVLIGVSPTVAFENHWIYWAAPIIGGLLAVIANWIKD